MKKLALLLLLLVGCTPVRYVIVDPKDSTKLVQVRTRIIYQDVYEPHIPLYFYNTQPFYRPMIMQRPIVIPRRDYQRPPIKRH